MSAKSIFEADGKAILNYHLTRAPVIKPTPLPASNTHNPPPRLASLHFAADADIKGVLDQAEVTYPWLLTPGSKFVAKPDQLIKRRGKSGLLALNKPWAEAREWIEARAGKPQRVETVDGVLRQFLVEPFVPHPQNTEYYININSVREVRGAFFLSSFAQSNIGHWGGAGAPRVENPGVVGHCLLCMLVVCSERLADARRAGSQLLFSGRPDEGKSYPDPLLQSTYPMTLIRQFTFTCELVFTASLSHRCTRIWKFPKSFVLRLLHAAFG
jgi:hypothetical protein